LPDEICLFYKSSTPKIYQPRFLGLFPGLGAGEKKVPFERGCKFSCIANLQMLSKRQFKEKEKLSHSRHHLKYAGRRILLSLNMNIKVHQIHTWPGTPVYSLQLLLLFFYYLIIIFG